MNSRSRFGLLYLVAFLGSAGATFLTMGIFYYTVNRWGWDAKLNLTLAAGQGVLYTISALLAHGISSRWGRRKSLVVIFAAMALVSGTGAMTDSHLFIVGCLLLYMFITGMNWPMLESLCSESTDAHELSRHIGAYNLTWAVSGAAAILSSGWLIEHWQAGLFILPLLLHGICSALILALLLWSPKKSSAAPQVHLEPEPDLLRARTLALWLSRIALPAMYVVNYALSAIFPLLPAMRHYTPAVQTLYGSIWVVSRMLVFALLGATAFWHTRPRLLLLSAFGLLLGFLAVTLAPSRPLAEHVAMIGGQLLLGAAMGMIYTASLYFGMVLSGGSTEHGGYHEALIGVGGTIGPGAGAIAQVLWPGDVRRAVAAVAGLVGCSVLAAAVTSIRLRKRVD